MKGKGSHSTNNEYEKHKVFMEGSKGERLGNSCKDKNISSSSSVTFKFEVKLEIMEKIMQNPWIAG
jgi:hypothetical protein